MSKKKNKKRNKIEKKYFYRISLNEKHGIIRERFLFSSELSFLQNLVGGLIDHVCISDELDENHIDCWINDEGKLLDYEPTFFLTDKDDKEVVDTVNGPLVFAKYTDDGETKGLTKKEIEYIDEWLDTLPMCEYEKGLETRCVYRISGFVPHPTMALFTSGSDFLQMLNGGPDVGIYL